LRRRDRESPGRLTQRELNILAELANGNTDQEIAAKLVVAKGTVKTYIRNVLRKLGARNRTQAVVHVVRALFVD
jgi:DNA-binding NarL/FixJ family response regulator